MLKLKFAIDHRAVCPHRLPMQNHWPNQALFKHSLYTTVFLIQQSCLIITFHC